MPWTSVNGYKGSVKEAYVHRDRKGSKPFPILFYYMLVLRRRVIILHISEEKMHIRRKIQ